MGRGTCPPVPVEKEWSWLMRFLEGLGNFIEESGFSGVVVLRRQDEVDVGVAAGYSNRTDEKLNTVDTRFGIASGCKLFTAVAIAQLVEKGLISFDTRLQDCLHVDFPHFDKNITIHHLLTHSSGMPDYFDEEVMDDFEDLWKTTPMYLLNNPKDFLPLFQKEKMKFSPGEKFQYNNAAFIVLGLIVEQQTGIAFTEYVEKNIFQRCGMGSSGYFPLNQLPTNTANGYIKQEDGTWKTNIYSIPYKGGADGGAFITAPDMIRFWEALTNFQLLTKDTTEKLLTPHINVKENSFYGYGIWINKHEGEIVKYHIMGYDPGVCFHSAVYPQLQTILVIPSNQSSGAYPIMKKIEETVLNL
jgi:CubicO group peptidase (beta-lactamase class C family)